MDIAYIILFKDGAMSLARHKPTKEGYQKGARFYEVLESTTVEELCNWFMHDHRSRLDTFKEIKSQPQGRKKGTK